MCEEHIAEMTEFQQWTHFFKKVISCLLIFSFLSLDFASAMKTPKSPQTDEEYQKKGTLVLQKSSPPKIRETWEKDAFTGRR